MKELTHQSLVKSPRHKPLCSACGGSPIKLFVLLLWAATLIGLSWGYFRPPARLSSVHCMLYVMFCLCPWVGRLCFSHDSSQVFAPFDAFLFFSTMVAPKTPLPKRRTPKLTYTEGSRYGNRTRHYMQFWCTYCGLRFHPRPLFWFGACTCCMYVLHVCTFRSTAEQPHVHEC